MSNNHLIIYAEDEIESISLIAVDILDGIEASECVFDTCNTFSEEMQLKCLAFLCSMYLNKPKINPSTSDLIKTQKLMFVTHAKGKKKWCVKKNILFFFQN